MEMPEMLTGDSLTRLLQGAAVAPTRGSRLEIGG